MNGLKAAGIALAFLLCGCGKEYIKPEVVRVEVPAFVKLPPDLTDCAYIAPEIATNGDLARAYQDVSAALQACARDAEAVRKLQDAQIGQKAD